MGKRKDVSTKKEKLIMYIEKFWVQEYKSLAVTYEENGEYRLVLEFDAKKFKQKVIEKFDDTLSAGNLRIAYWFLDLM